jgi:hypothetical protein
MQKMSPISTFEIALDIRAGRIPVRWTVRDSHRPEERDSSGRVIWKSEVERVFWPQVELNKWGEAVVAEIEGPLDLRAHLFKAVNTNWSEKAVLAFLDRAGAWRILPAAREEEWAKGTYANVEFLHRYRTAVQILAVTVKELREEAEYWYRLLQCLGDPAKLKKAFRPPPGGEARISDVIMFGLETRSKNTLPVSLEWQGRDPRAVIETITAAELLAAAAWADVASHTGPQVCGHCMTRFASARKKKYCRPDCGHAVAVRNYKRKLALAKKGQRVGAEAHTSDS